MGEAMSTCCICNTKSNIIYSTRKYGEICNNCMWEINNSEEKKKEKELEKVEMYRRYNINN